MKNENIILRVSTEEHELIKLKSELFGQKKSDFLRNAAFSYWDDSNTYFKKILDLYTNNEDLRDKIVNLLFTYYRRYGFPYCELDDNEKNIHMRRLINTKDVLLEDNLLQHNVVGISLANSFHPQMMSVQYKSGKLQNPVEVFNNDKRLKHSIHKWLKLDKTPNHSGIRRIVRTYKNTRTATNFKPAISKFIYQKFCPSGGKVLDPCSGYSGRLIGCIAANKNISYCGVDPEPLMGKGNMDCASFFKDKYNFGFSFHLGCAEDEMKAFSNSSFDLVFTSPPYFNIETYSDNSEQSIHKYNDYEKWLNKFLFVIIEESFRVLKESGVLALNVKNYKDFPLEDAVKSKCKQMGFSLEDIYYMKLPNNEYHRINESGHNYHTEPIMIFRKSWKN